MKDAWRCSECGITRPGAIRRRVRLGLRPLSPGAIVCTPACARDRERRLLRERYGPGTAYAKDHAKRWKGKGERPVRASLAPQLPAGGSKAGPRQLRAWTCSECGRSLSEVHEALLARGLKPRSLYSPTCSDRCEARRFRRFQEEARRRGFDLDEGDWHCLECGLTVDEVLAKGARNLSTRAVTCSPECYAERTRRKQAALMRSVKARARTRERRRRLRREQRSSGK